ncbi:hypothetical protein NPIL_42311 [Nephila pilipes]|uniref:Uncharacterized protein n=1 Tax=Nephila pilipes TaxID=299642 RepID=A0A8X6I2D9_NEPPI|nr:hypothetical protein NPIL_42311 [Nephila pilipes]
MDVLGEEAQKLVVEPIFNISLDIIIVGKSLSLQSFLKRTEDMVVTRREVRTYVAALTILPKGSHSNRSGPSTSKKHINMTLPAPVDERAFFGRGNEGCHHFMLMLLVAGSKLCTMFHQRQ